MASNYGKQQEMTVQNMEGLRTKAKLATQGDAKELKRCYPKNAVGRQDLKSQG